MILDTDVLIDVQRGHPPALAWFMTPDLRLEVPGYVAMELFQDARNSREVRIAQALVAPFPVAWPDAASSNDAMRAYAHLHLSHGLGLIDALVAATAVSRGSALVTYNVKHYAAYPGLDTVQPYSK